MIPGTDWMIGTGAYMDDIQTELANYKQTMQSHTREKITTLLLIALF